MFIDLVHLICLFGLISSELLSLFNRQDNPLNQSYSLSSSTENYLVGNLSQSFTFQIAPSTTKITYLGLNGYSLFIMGVGFSNQSKFNYDEQNNQLKILSLDASTVGHYSAVDSNWKTFNTIVTAINSKIVN